MWRSDKRLWLTDDKTEIVEDGDERARFLLVPAGGEIDEDVAIQHGLLPARPAIEEDDRYRVPNYMRRVPPGATGAQAPSDTDERASAPAATVALDATPPSPAPPGPASPFDTASDPATEQPGGTGAPAPAPGMAAQQSAAAGNESGTAEPPTTRTEPAPVPSVEPNPDTAGKEVGQQTVEDKSVHGPDATK